MMWQFMLTQFRLFVDEIRVRFHLQRVERKLRSANVTHLPLAEQVARQQRLMALNHYWRYERIPRNFDHQHRIPCFIDRAGGKCAVAHMVIDSGYRDVTQTVVAEANDAYIKDMNFSALDLWASQNGFTKDELALIQPSYCPAPEGAQLITSTAIIYSIAWLLVIAELPFAMWNIYQGWRHNADGRRAINSSMIIGLLLIGFAAIIGLSIASGSDVLWDGRVLSTTHGFNGEPCEDIVYSVTYNSVALLMAISFVYLGSAGWRIYRGNKPENQLI